jgi:hypothetical protein
MQKSPEIMMMSRPRLDVLVDRGRAPARKAYSHGCQALYNHPLPSSPRVGLVLRPQFLLLKSLNHNITLGCSRAHACAYLKQSGQVCPLPFPTASLVAAKQWFTSARSMEVYEL